MNMKKAMAAVLDKFPDVGTRTHAVLFLERYSDQRSPFTAWNAYGEEADAVRTVLAELGMAKDTDWKETLSSLDPKAVRFHWTDAGAAKLAALPNWNGAETRRRLILRLDNPLEGVPDEPESDESESDESRQTADGPGLTAEILKQTAEIAKKVPDMLNHSNPPIAPLWAMEQAARADRVDWLPEFNLFARPSNCINAAWVAARPLWAGETHLPVIADKIGFLPLPEQVGPESPMSSPINGYLAYTVDELANVSDPRGEIDGMWAQFQAFLRAPTDSNYDGIGVLQFATDGRKMAQLVTRLVEYSYPGFSCNLLPTTHVAVHNDLSNDRSEAADDDGCLRERLDNSTCSNSVCYVGGFVLSRGGHVEPGDGWDAAKPLVITTGDVPEAIIAETTLTTEELGAEWFMMVHQNRSFRTVAPDGALVAFRKSVQDLREDHAAMATLCSPHNAAYALNSVDNTSTPHGALVNGVCAAIRKVALGTKTLGFVDDSPFEPDNFVSAVWSGIETDLAPDDLAEAMEESVFPTVGEVPFGRPWSEADARRTTDLLMLLRERPDIQLGFAKRTSQSHRSRVVIIETNVDAKQFLALNPDNTFVAGLRKQFVTSFVARSGDPLSSVTWSSSWSFTTRFPSSMHGFYSALQQAYADIDPRAANRICGDTLDSYTTDSDPKIRVGFLVDVIGRLIIVIRTLSGLLVERMHVAWRYCEGLPLVPAATLRRTGRLPGTVVIDSTMSGGDRRNAYLHGMAKQARCWEDSVDPTMTLSSAYGRTTFVYAFQGVLSGWDYEEALPSQWYTSTPSRICVSPRS